MNIVSYRPGTDRTPRQLPPLTTGPFQSVERAARNVSCIWLTSPLVPAFSSSPPGITITLSALRCSTTSMSESGICAAETLRISRSTGAGSERIVGTAWQPSISETPGLITKIDFRSNPSRITLFRITWPGFICDETPAIAIDWGASRLRSLRTGRGVTSGMCPVPIVASTSSATSSPPHGTSGLISRSLMQSGRHTDESQPNFSTTSQSLATLVRAG